MREAISGVKNPKYKHGGKGTRLYRIWKGFRSRCNSHSATSWKWYGAIGIGYCKEWDDFAIFRDWATNNGYSEELTIERIDSTKNYEPSNCTWGTLTQQQSNKCSNRH